MHITFILMYCRIIIYIVYSCNYIPCKFEQTYVEVFTTVYSQYVMKEGHWDVPMSLTE